MARANSDPMRRSYVARSTFPEHQRGEQPERQGGHCDNAVDECALGTHVWFGPEWSMSSVRWKASRIARQQAQNG